MSPATPVERRLTAFLPDEEDLDQDNPIHANSVARQQGFKAALIPVVEELTRRGVTVLVAGITFDSWGRPFDPMPQLAEMADEEIIRQAPCRVCGEPAPFSQRMTPIATEFMIGGADDYEPRCADHFVPSSEPPEER